VNRQDFQGQLDAERKFTRELGAWIKNNLGSNLELLNQLLNGRIATELKKQEEEAKKREEGLWLIFGMFCGVLRFAVFLRFAV
jgi:hypothetical protein